MRQFRVLLIVLGLAAMLLGNSAQAALTYTWDDPNAVDWTWNDTNGGNPWTNSSAAWGGEVWMAQENSDGAVGYPWAVEAGDGSGGRSHDGWGNSHTSLVFSSPSFYLESGNTNDITAELWGGDPISDAPTAGTDGLAWIQANHPIGLDNTGWQGIGLRDVVADIYVGLASRAGDGNNWQTATIPNASITPGVEYQLDFIDYAAGSWGWSAMDEVYIPGVTLTPENNWLGTTSSDWSDGTNWSLGTAPAVTAPVVIDNNTTNSTHVLNATDGEANSVELWGTTGAPATLVIEDGGTLTVADSITMWPDDDDPVLTVALGGQLTAGSLTSDGTTSFTLGVGVNGTSLIDIGTISVIGGTMDVTGGTFNPNNLTLQGGALTINGNDLTVDGTLTLAGVSMDTNNVDIATLTVNDGIVVSTGSTLNLDQSPFSVPNLTVQHGGTLTFQLGTENLAATSSLTLNGSSLTTASFGALDTTGATISVLDEWADGISPVATLTADADAVSAPTIILRGGAAVEANGGTIAATSGLILQGTDVGFAVGGATNIAVEDDGSTPGYTQVNLTGAITTTGEFTVTGGTANPMVPMLSLGKLSVSNGTMNIVQDVTVQPPSPATPNALMGSLFQNTTGGNYPGDNPMNLDGAAYFFDPSRVYSGTQAGTLLWGTSDPTWDPTLITSAVSSWAGWGLMFPGFAGADNFCTAFSGVFTPPTTGSYHFRSDSDDQALMYIDVGLDGVFDATDRATTQEWHANGDVTLQAGVSYPIMFMSREWGGGESSNWWITAPTQGEVFINPGDGGQSGWWATAPARALSVFVSGGILNVDATLTTYGISQSGGEINIKRGSTGVVDLGIDALTISDGTFTVEASVDPGNPGTLTTTKINQSGGTINLESATAPNLPAVVNLATDGSVNQTGGTFNAGTAFGDATNTWTISGDPSNSLDGVYNANVAGSLGPAATATLNVNSGGTVNLNAADVISGHTVNDITGKVVVAVNGGGNGAVLNLGAGGYVKIGVTQSVGPPNLFPEVHLAALGGLGGDLTGAEYGGVDPDPQNVFLALDAVLAPDPIANLPTRDQAGGALLYQGIPDLAGTYNLGDNLVDSIFKGGAFGPEWTPSPAFFDGTINDISNDGPGNTGIELQMLMAVEIDDVATLNTTDTVKGVEFIGNNPYVALNVLRIHEFPMGTATKITRTGTYETGNNTTGRGIVRLEENAVGVNKTLVVNKGMVDTRHEWALADDPDGPGGDAPGTLVVGPLAGIALRDWPDGDWGADRIMQGHVVMGPGSIAMVDGSSDRFKNGVSTWDFSPDMYLALRDNIVTQDLDIADPLRYTGSLDNINFIIAAADQMYDIRLGDGRRVTKFRNQGDWTHNDNCRFIPSTSNPPEHVIFSSPSGQWTVNSGVGGELNIRSQVLLAGIDILVNDAYTPDNSEYLDLPYNENDMTREPVAQDGYVRFAHDVVQFKSMIVRNGYASFGNDDGDTIQSTGYLHIKDNGGVELRQFTNIWNEVKAGTLFDQVDDGKEGIIVDRGGYLRVMFRKEEGTDPYGPEVNQLITMTGTPEVAGAQGNWVGDFNHFQVREDTADENSDLRVHFNNIVLEDGAAVRVQRDWIGRHQLHLSTRLEGDAEIAMGYNDFTFVNITSDALATSLDPARTLNQGRVGEGWLHLYLVGRVGGDGVNPDSKVIYEQVVGGMDIWDGASIAPDSELRNRGDQGGAGRDGHLRMFAGHDGTNPITGGGRIVLGGGQDIDICVDDHDTTPVENHLGVIIKVVADADPNDWDSDIRPRASHIYGELSGIAPDKAVSGDVYFQLEIEPGARAAVRSHEGTKAYINVEVLNDPLAPGVPQTAQLFTEWDWGAYIGDITEETPGQGNVLQFVGGSTFYMNGTMYADAEDPGYIGNPRAYLTTGFDLNGHTLTLRNHDHHIVGPPTGPGLIVKEINNHFWIDYGAYGAMSPWPADSGVQVELAHWDGVRIQVDDIIAGMAFVNDVKMEFLVRDGVNAQIGCADDNGDGPGDPGTVQLMKLTLGDGSTADLQSWAAGTKINILNIDLGPNNGAVEANGFALTLDSLTGDGRIYNGTVTLNPGGTLAPGSSGGAIDLQVNTTISAGVQYDFELGPVAVDTVNVTGDLNLNNFVDLNVSTLGRGTLASEAFPVFTYGSLSGDAFPGVLVPNYDDGVGGSMESWDMSAVQLVMINNPPDQPQGLYLTGMASPNLVSNNATTTAWEVGTTWDPTGTITPEMSSFVTVDGTDVVNLTTAGERAFELNIEDFATLNLQSGDLDAYEVYVVGGQLNVQNTASLSTNSAVVSGGQLDVQAGGSMDVTTTLDVQGIATAIIGGTLSAEEVTTAGAMIVQSTADMSGVPEVSVTAGTLDLSAAMNILKPGTGTLITTNAGAAITRATVPSGATVNTQSTDLAVSEKIVLERTVDMLEIGIDNPAGSFSVQGADLSGDLAGDISLITVGGDTVTLQQYVPNYTQGLEGEYYDFAPVNVNSTWSEFASLATMDAWRAANIATVNQRLDAPDILSLPGPPFNGPDGVNPFMNLTPAVDVGVDNIVFFHEGLIKIDVEADYTFHTNSDDGTNLLIDDQMVVYNNYFQGVTRRSGTIHLEEGYHKFFWGGYEGGGGAGFYASWESAGAGIVDQIIPASVLFTGSATQSDIDLPDTDLLATSSTVVDTPATNVTLRNMEVAAGADLTLEWAQYNVTDLTLRNGASVTLPDDNSLNVGGTVSVGDSVGTGTVNGGFLMLGATSTLAVEIDGASGPATASADLLSGANNAMIVLDGTLSVTPLAGFETYIKLPAPAEFYRGALTIVDADVSSSIAGTFSAAPAPGTYLGGGVFADDQNADLSSVDYSDPKAVKIEILRAKAGDLDGDRDVDIVDFTELSVKYDGGAGTTKVWTDGDFEFDGDVDINDFTILSANYDGGAGYAAAAAAGAPEAAVAAVAAMVAAPSLVIYDTGAVGLRATDAFQSLSYSAKSPLGAFIGLATDSAAPYMFYLMADPTQMDAGSLSFMPANFPAGSEFTLSWTYDVGLGQDLGVTLDISDIGGIFQAGNVIWEGDWGGVGPELVTLPNGIMHETGPVAPGELYLDKCDSVKLEAGPGHLETVAALIGGGNDGELPDQMVQWTLFSRNDPIVPPVGVMPADLALVSDVVQIDVLGADPTGLMVLEIEFDPDELGLLYPEASLEDVYMVKSTGAEWMPVGIGDPVVGGYDDVLAMGHWGIDTSDWTVWAVVEQGDPLYAVIPEPGTVMLLLSGVVCGLMLWRRRRSK